MSNTEKKPVENKPQAQQQRRPNETGTVSVQAYMRIFDPTTQKTIVEGRA